MKEKWLNTPFSYRVVILFHAALMLLFILLYATLGRQQVVRHEDELFRQRQEDNALTYTGKLNGEKAVLTLLPDDSLDILVGNVHYGPYTVTEDPSALPEDSVDADIPSRILTGVEVRECNEVLFRGGFYEVGPMIVFYGSNGEHYSLPSRRLLISEGYPEAYTSQLIEPSLKTILRFTLERGTVPRGTVGFLLFGLFCSAACILFAFYEEELFRHRLRYTIKNAENAEPSEWELMSRWISWLALTVLALVLYIEGLSAPVLN